LGEVVGGGCPGRTVVVLRLLLLVVAGDPDLPAERSGELVGALRRQHGLGHGEVAHGDQGADLVGDVAELDNPPADIAAGRLTGQANLNGPVIERAEPKRALWILLDPDRAGRLLLGPCRAAGVGAWLVVAEAGVGKRPLEAVPGDRDREHALLAGLGGPTGAVHHPQERGLDPGHPVELERRDERPSGERALGDLRRIGLIQGDVCSS
jgi:hypothetical protein